MSLLLLFGGATADPVASVRLGQRVLERPPLRHYVRGKTPDGTPFRWGPGRNSDAVIQGLGWTQEIGGAGVGGDASLRGRLLRQPGRNWSDLGILTELDVMGAGRQLRASFLLDKAGDVSGDVAEIGPEAVGRRALLEFKKDCREVYRDISLDGWRGPSGARKKQLQAAGVYRIDEAPSVAPTLAGIPSLSMETDGEWAATSVAFVDAWLDSTVDLGRIEAIVEDNGNGGSATWFTHIGLATGETGFADISADIHPGAGGTSALTGVDAAAGAGRRLAHVEFGFGAALANAQPSVAFGVFLTVLARYGAHGLTRQGSGSAKGFLTSQILAHAVRKFAPQLDFTTGPDGSIQDSVFVHQQAAYPDPTTVAEIGRDVTRVELRDFFVFGNTVYLLPRDVGIEKWVARSGPSKLRNTGQQLGRTWDRITVQFNDVDGTTKTAGPPGSGATVESAYLQVTDSENPLVKKDWPKGDLLIMNGVAGASAKNKAEVAIEVGRRWLEETALLDSSGSAELVGWVQNEKGYWAPAAAVKVRDTIRFVDASDPSPRRIVTVDYDVDSAANSIDLDAPPQGLEVLQERLNVVLKPYGL